MRLLKTVSVVLALALVAGACGDDDDEEGAVSKADFVKQANAICERHMAEFEALFETDFPTTPEKIPAFFAKATPIVKKQNAELAALERPEADKEELDEIFALADRVEADFDKASTDATFGAELFEDEGGKNSKELDDKAKDYGLTKCVEEEDDEDEPKLDPATFSPEKRAFVEKGDALCTSFDEKDDALEEQYLKTFPPPKEAWAEFLPRITTLFKEHLAAFKKLTPPAADKATIADLIAKQEALIPKIEEAGAAAKAGDQAKLDPLLQELFPAFEPIDDGLKAYGFQVCGSEDDDDEEDGGDEDGEEEGGQ